VAIGRDEFEEKREVIVFDIGVNQFFAGAVHDADIHLAGMKVDSAVELCGGGVILHNDHSLWGRETPGVIRLVMRRVLVTLSALQFMLSKNPKGFEGSIKSPEPIGSGASDQSVTPVSVSVADCRWLSFCR